MQIEHIIRDVSDLGIPVKTVTTTYTVLSEDHVVLCDASGGAFTVTLPVLSSIPDEKIYYIKKIDSSVNVVTIASGG